MYKKRKYPSVIEILRYIDTLSMVIGMGLKNKVDGCIYDDRN